MSSWQKCPSGGGFDQQSKVHFLFYATFELSLNGVAMECQIPLSTSDVLVQSELRLLASLSIGGGGGGILI